MQSVARLQGLVGGVAHRAAHADGVVVAQVAPDLADDHRHGVGGEAHVLCYVKVVKRLDQPDTANLEQVIHVLRAVVEALEHAEHQPQVAANELLARGHVAAMTRGKTHACAHWDQGSVEVSRADFDLAVAIDFAPYARDTCIMKAQKKIFCSGRHFGGNAHIGTERFFAK